MLTAAISLASLVGALRTQMMVSKCRHVAAMSGGHFLVWLA